MLPKLILICYLIAFVSITCSVKILNSEKFFFLYKCQVHSDLKDCKKKSRSRDNINRNSVVTSSENVRLCVSF